MTCPESGTEDFILLYQRCSQCQLRVMLGSCKECQKVRRGIMDRSFPSQGSEPAIVSLGEKGKEGRVLENMAVSLLPQKLKSAQGSGPRICGQGSQGGRSVAVAAHRTLPADSS